MTNGTAYKQLKNGDYGVVVTLEHRTSALIETLHVKGQGRIGPLATALEDYDPARWRVVCISTPQTIYDDITFRRALIEPADDYRGDGEGRDLSGSIGGTRHPEPYMLGKIPNGRDYL
jgi:hypothetical protein